MSTPTVSKQYTDHVGCRGSSYWIFAYRLHSSHNWVYRNASKSFHPNNIVLSIDQLYHRIPYALLPHDNLSKPLISHLSNPQLAVEDTHFSPFYIKILAKQRSHKLSFSMKQTPYPITLMNESNWSNTFPKPTLNQYTFSHLTKHFEEGWCLQPKLHMILLQSSYRHHQFQKYRVETDHIKKGHRHHHFSY